MPYINLQITKGATREQKSEVVRQMTATLVDVLGKSPEHVHIVIQEVDDDNWGFSGMLTSDWRKRQASDGQPIPTAKKYSPNAASGATPFRAVIANLLGPNECTGALHSPLFPHWALDLRGGASRLVRWPSEKD